MAALSIESLRKTYGSVTVLEEISLKIDDGDFLVLVGPSGCGKSTLLNMIAGLDHPTSGNIRIGERVVNDVHPKDRDIAMVFQSYALYPNMSVKKNITFGMEIRGVPADERAAAVARVSKLLQIDHLLDRKPSQLSGGQRQRVAMGRALVRAPQVFLFDEPLSNLDAKLRVEMRVEIKKLHQRLNATIVYVTHDQIEAMTLATKVAVMKGGIVQQFADPQTIYREPANMFVAGFIGTPSMNFIPATVVQDGNRLGVAVANRDGGTTFLALPVGATGVASRLGESVVLGIRPEHVSPWRESEAASGRHAPFEATIELTEPTGADTMVFLKLGGTEVEARIHPDEAAAPGSRMRFLVDMGRASLFDPRTELRIPLTEPSIPARELAVAG